MQTAKQRDELETRRDREREIGKQSQSCSEGVERYERTRCDNNSCIFPILSTLNKMETDSTIYDNKAKISKIILLALSSCLRVL